MKKFAATGLLFFAGFFAVYAQNLPSVRIVNNTGTDIYNLYISPSVSDEWGAPLLGEDILEDGKTITITLSQPLGKNNRYDFMVDDEERMIYYKLNVTVTNNARIVFTLDDLYTGNE